MYDTTKRRTRGILEELGFNDDYPASTDGIGTKGIYHWKARIYPEINSARRGTLDALAMNFNDMAVKRAKVNLLQDHLFLPIEDGNVIREILKTLKDECNKRGIIIVSGDTAIHNSIGDLEISVSVIGDYVQQRENYFESSDILIGLQSSGLMANGFTQVRKIFGEKVSKGFLEELTKPTFIYYDDVLPLIKKFDIHGMCHVTGGAYTKLKNILGENDVIIKRNHKLKPHEIFYELQRKGRISDEEMYKIFNCGIGFILSVSDGDKEEIIQNLLGKEYDVDVIGEVLKGTGNVKIESMFSNKEIVL